MRSTSMAKIGPDGKPDPNGVPDTNSNRDNSSIPPQQKKILLDEIPTMSFRAKRSGVEKSGYRTISIIPMIAEVKNRSSMAVEKAFKL